MKLTFIAICGLMVAPLSSYGATMTLVQDAEPASNGGFAKLLNGSMALFTIQFEFTDEIFDVSVPIAAEYGVTYADRVDTVGYALKNEAGEEVKPAKVSALVLSDTTVKDNKYFLPKGQSGLFTLFVLADYSDSTPDSIEASITKLPYFLNDRRTTVHQNQLNELDTPSLKVSE